MSLKDIKRFYAIKNGYLCNVIVGSWIECENLVHGYKNAKYKGFHYESEAKEWLKKP